MFLPTPLAVAWVNILIFSPSSSSSPSPSSSSASSPHHQLFVSLRYRKHSGVWVFHCDAILFYIDFKHQLLSIFTHAPCGSLGQQTDFFSSSSPPSHLQLLQVQKTPWGGAWVLGCVCHLVYSQSPPDGTWVFRWSFYPQSLEVEPWDYR